MRCRQCQKRCPFRGQPWSRRRLRWRSLWLAEPSMLELPFPLYWKMIYICVHNANRRHHHYLESGVTLLRRRKKFRQINCSTFYGKKLFSRKFTKKVWERREKIFLWMFSQKISNSVEKTKIFWYTKIFREIDLQVTLSYDICKGQRWFHRRIAQLPHFKLSSDLGRSFTMAYFLLLFLYQKGKEIMLINPIKNFWRFNIE